MRFMMRHIWAIFLAGSLVAACNGQQDNQRASGASEQAETERVVEGLVVSNPSAFEEAIAGAKPGDRIILANGIWEDFDILFEGEGTAQNPIELVAQTPGEVILSGQSSLRIAGQYLVVSGLVFRDGYSPRNEVISFRKDAEKLAFNSRVTNTVIDGYSNPNRSQRDIWVAMYGRNNVFDYNHLSGKQNAGPTFAVRLNTEESQENAHRIAYNYFGPRPVFGSNGGETMRIGTSHYSLTRSATVVEHNFFDRCSGEVEIISSKSGDNVFRSNTFYASRGTLTLRHGNGTLVENNLFDGAGAPYTGGVRVINARQTIRNNYFRGLTGNRFSGALVVMNGVPNSPINRYHQVDGAVITGNVFDGVRAIELGEGSDAERTAIPINSAFENNIVIGAAEASPFSLYDDMSGVRFAGNTAAQTPPAALADGFRVEAGLDASSRDAADYGVTREETGVAWYPKVAEGSPFRKGQEIRLNPGTDVLWEALERAAPGDQFILSAGHYHEAKIITVDVPVTLRAAGGQVPVLSFERPHMFVLSGNGGLELEGLKAVGTSAPDGSGNSFISTSSSLGSDNHRLIITDMQFEDFDVNRGFSVATAAKGAFFDEITVSKSSFKDISGIVFKLDEETDDYGIYNAEYLTITDSTFENIGGPIASVYRGGRDESTFGPHADVSGSTFTNIGRNGAPLMRLHGIQNGSFSGNAMSDTQPLSVTYTTGLPIFAMSDNRVDGASQDAFAEITDLRNRK